MTLSRPPFIIMIRRFLRFGQGRENYLARQKKLAENWKKFNHYNVVKFPRSAVPLCYNNLTA
ncbi:MAG TPA: hypothetical protein DC013_09315 [Ruminococcaceae bacterium]|jgi:hypothetical protein|nr:hypothetical protein [Oscillospiraceae bacterium]